MKNVFQSSTPTIRTNGQKAFSLSLTGNGNFGNVTRTGWSPCNLGLKKKAAIINAIEDPYTDRVWRVDGNVFRMLLNGVTEKVI